MNQSGNLMRKRQLYRTTLRFRKWSRKAYAAFASLGRCVTIGCLPKSVADSSLSKQKSGTSAGCKSGRQSLEDTDNDKGQETDIGIPLGSENGLGTKLEIFGFRGLMPVLCPATIGPKGKKYVNPPYLKTRQGLDINTIINKSGTHGDADHANAVFRFARFASHVFRGKGSSSQKSFFRSIGFTSFNS